MLFDRGQTAFTDSPNIEGCGLPYLGTHVLPVLLLLLPALLHSLPGLLTLLEEGKPLGKHIRNKSQSVFIKNNNNKGQKRGCCPQQLAALPPTVTSISRSSTRSPDRAKQARKMRRHGRGGRRTSETIIGYESEIWTTAFFFFPLLVILFQAAWACKSLITSHLAHQSHEGTGPLHNRASLKLAPTNNKR